MYNSKSLPISTFKKVPDNKITFCLISSLILFVRVGDLLQKCVLAERGHLEVVVEVDSYLRWRNRRRNRKRLSITLSNLFNNSFWKTLGKIINFSTKSETVSTYTLIGNVFEVDHQNIHSFIVLLMKEGGSIKILLHDQGRENKVNEAAIRILSPLTLIQSAEGVQWSNDSISYLLLFLPHKHL